MEGPIEGGLAKLDEPIESIAETFEDTRIFSDIDSPPPDEEKRVVEAELEELRTKCVDLQAHLDNTRTLLANQMEINEELKKTRQALSDEIMDLTKALFEEANGMVAEEAKARAKLEITRRKLEAELESTKEHLCLEKQQLFELRDKLGDRKRTITTTTTMDTMSANETFSKDTFVNILDHHYFPCLLPKHRVNSRIKSESASGHLWDEISQRFDTEELKEFGKFVERITEYDAESMLGQCYLKKICETDVAPCLNFDFKPRPFVKKIAIALLKNTCCIEKVKIQQSTSSPGKHQQHARMGSGSSGASDLTEMADLQMSMPDEISRPSLSLSTTTSERLRGIMNHFTTSVSSLPESLLSNTTTTVEQNSISSTSPTFISPHLPLSSSPPSSTSVAKFCSLCGRCNTFLAYRFRLNDGDSWILIDKHCRQKLVAAGHFFTFLRHIRSGLYSSRPILDLYYDSLHYRRYMFYTRVAPSATIFFLQSDYEAFLDIVEARISFNQNSDDNDNGNGNENDNENDNDNSRNNNNSNNNNTSSPSNGQHNSKTEMHINTTTTITDTNTAIIIDNSVTEKEKQISSLLIEEKKDRQQVLSSPSLQHVIAEGRVENIENCSF